MTDNASSFMKWLRRQADIVQSLGIVGGALVAVIAIFGGSFPPWQTPAQAQSQQRTNAEIQSGTVQALGKINEKLDTLARRVDRGECNTLRETLDQANSVLVQTPTNAMARALRDSTRSRMLEIQSCIP